MKVNDKIKLILKSKNLSQGDLAKILNVSRQVVSLYLKSDNITLNTIRKISNALDIPIVELFNDELNDSHELEKASLRTDITHYKELCKELEAENQQLKDKIIELQAQLIEKLTK